MFNAMWEEYETAGESGMVHGPLLKYAPPKEPTPPSGGRAITPSDHASFSVCFAGPRNDPSPPSGGRSLSVSTVGQSHCVLVLVSAASYRPLSTPLTKQCPNMSKHYHQGRTDRSEPKPKPAPPSGGRTLSMLPISAIKFHQTLGALHSNMLYKETAGHAPSRHITS